ncbi:Ig-like domain-containing protein [Exiguobacterium antarcticum]|uniref:Ig-like domain-containing protein n=1 Tax=Exiguobacterium antarcticum TaxID=132920 RepID=A0ABT6R645_9BACL|nr:Ig-like domain-containing protein [Exiguobacterium antarcticum]MDI3236402.1 Ig-like domain-containing protein [Exiguobacterium antarcticum]
MKNRFSILAVPIIYALTVASIPVSASTNDPTLLLANRSIGESNVHIVQGSTLDVEETLPEVYASRGSGIEYEGEEVELTATKNTKIYYTTDGTVPTIKSTVYSKPIVLSGKVSLRFMAVDELGNKSEIGEQEYYTYSVDSKLENEEIMVGSGVPGMKITIDKEGENIGQEIIGESGQFKIEFERQKVDTILTVIAEIDSYIHDRHQIQVWDDTPPKFIVPLEMTDDVLVLKGQSEVGATISISDFEDEDRFLGEGEVKSDGTFEVPFKRPEGNKISAMSTDQNGTQNEVIITLKDVKAPVISSISPIYDNHPMFYVIAEGGNSLIEVFKNGKRIASTKTSASRDQDAYYFTIDKQKAGTLLLITITDPSGNKSKPYQAIVKDATAPSAPKVVAFSDAMTALTGTAENNSTIIVMNGSKKVGQATSSSGKFSVKLAKQKAGTTLTVYAMDAAKNKSQSVRLKVTDKTAPLTPTASTITTKTTSLSGKTEAKAVVYLYKGKTKVASATANAKGIYKLTFKAQATGTKLSLYAMDGAKNKSKTRLITVSVFKKSNAMYLKEHYTAAKKGTMYKAEAKLYDRMKITGKDAIYGQDSTGCCVFGKIKGTFVYGTIGYDENYPNHVGDIMTMPSFDNRKIKWTEVTSALGKPKVHRKAQKNEWNKMVYLVNKKVTMNYDLAGTIEYKPTPKTTFWADYDYNGYVRAFGIRYF